ncbi:HAD family hydrolase [Streptomyces jumonjinensis]|uniref:Phosphoglycolate phosphatase n=1 Tax=Streptomyces jumonjinensis TaxID=1945 RepID=A0A646KG67_STRJU|nr:HAD hydrolase-like protein [Streptomyces jumonjinensis]MQT01223.1 phosphoglycolate phosphatase [Streptomyces jumonjinensis]
MILVLWDIDRTLLYVGDVDRLVYRTVFEKVVGRAPERLPAKGTGVTMPVAVKELLTVNGVPAEQVDAFAQRIIGLMPGELEWHRERMLTDGLLLPGAVDSLTAVRKSPHLLPTVVTGNLQASAEIKLSTFDLIDLVDPAVGGYASDDPHRPALVSVAQQRAGAVYGRSFDRSNTVIVGDSLEDVRTGREGGARVIGVSSGTTSAADLADAGADHVITDLTDPSQLLRLIGTEVT